MKVIINIDPNHEEDIVTIHAKEWSEDLEELVNRLKKTKPQKLIGVLEEQSIVLDPKELVYVYAEQRKVLAVSSKLQQPVELRMKLYEVEELLKPYQFIRFSKSVVGNVNQIERFELSFNGNLRVIFKSGHKEYVTRNYVQSLKENLTIAGDRHDI